MTGIVVGKSESEPSHWDSLRQRKGTNFGKLPAPVFVGSPLLLCLFLKPFDSRQESSTVAAATTISSFSSLQLFIFFFSLLIEAIWRTQFGLIRTKEREHYTQIILVDCNYQHNFWFWNFARIKLLFYEPWVFLMMIRYEIWGIMLDQQQQRHQHRLFGNHLLCFLIAQSIREEKEFLLFVLIFAMIEFLTWKRRSNRGNSLHYQYMDKSHHWFWYIGIRNKENISGILLAWRSTYQLEFYLPLLDLQLMLFDRPKHRPDATTIRSSEGHKIGCHSCSTNKMEKRNQSKLAAIDPDPISWSNTILVSRFSSFHYLTQQLPFSFVAILSIVIVLHRVPVQFTLAQYLRHRQSFSFDDRREQVSKQAATSS